RGAWRARAARFPADAGGDRIGAPAAVAAAGGSADRRRAQRVAAVRFDLSKASRRHPRQPSNNARIAAYSIGSRQSVLTTHQKCSTASAATAYTTLCNRAQLRPSRLIQPLVEVMASGTSSSQAAKPTVM